MSGLKFRVFARNQTSDCPEMPIVKLITAYITTTNMYSLIEIRQNILVQYHRIYIGLYHYFYSQTHTTPWSWMAWMKVCRVAIVFICSNCTSVDPEIDKDGWGINI